MLTKCGGVMKKRYLLIIIVLLLTLSSVIVIYNNSSNYKVINTDFDNAKSGISISEEAGNKSNLSSFDSYSEVRTDEEITTVIDDSYFETDSSVLNVNEKTDDEVVNYVNEVVIDATSDEAKSDSNESKLRNTFIKLTDFIFYGGEIKGYTFNQLSNEGKEKVLSSYEKLDSYIENKYPNYKEKIKDTSSRTYSKLKEKAFELKESINNTFREKVGDEIYSNTTNQFNEDKQNLSEVIEPYKSVGEDIKEKSKEVYQDTKSRLSEWYQNYKNSK